MLASTSVLTIVSLSFSVAYHLCGHFTSSPRFTLCFSELILSTRYHSFSLSLHVLDDDAFSSPSIPDFLVIGYSTFPLADHIRYQWSLSPSVDGDSFMLRESLLLFRVPLSFSGYCKNFLRKFFIFLQCICKHTIDINL